MSETIKEKIQAPYKFTERETCELARKLAHANQRKAELEGQKKSSMSDFAARIDREQAEASLLAQHISQGYEMRETEVNVTLFPKEGTKRYHNAKTLEFIREERMTQADYQIEMQFERKREAEKQAALPAEHDHRVEIKGPGNKVLLTVMVHTQPHGCGWRSRFTVVDGANDKAEGYTPPHDSVWADEGSAVWNARKRAAEYLRNCGTLPEQIQVVEDGFAKIEDALDTAASSPESKPAESPAPKRRGRPKKNTVETEVVPDPTDANGKFYKFRGHGAAVIVTVPRDGDAWKSRFDANTKDRGCGEPFSDDTEATEYDALHTAGERALRWLETIASKEACDAFKAELGKFETDLIAAAQKPAIAA